MRRAFSPTTLLLVLALVAVAAVRCVPAEAQATVALDANSSSQTGLTWTHTVGSSATNIVLLVGVSLNGGFQVTGVAWSGTNPTFSCLFAIGVNGSGSSVGSCGTIGSSVSRRVEIWGAALGTPSTKTGTVTVTLSGSTSTLSGSVSYSGAAQTSTFGTAKGTAGQDSPASLSFSGLAATGAVMDAIAISTSQPITSFGSGQTQLWKAANGSNVYGASSYATGSVTGMSQSWTGGSTHWAYVAVPINPAPPAARKGQVIVGHLEPMNSNDARSEARD